MLARRLRPAERAAIARSFGVLLGRGRTFDAPATAFVSLYERGRVIGCVGHADPRHALEASRHDPRFGGARMPDAAPTAVLSFLVRGRTIPVGRVVDQLALGDEGLVALDAAGAVRAVLLPEAAADTQRDAAAMLRALLEKAGAHGEHEIPRVVLVRTERFVRRAEGRPPRPARNLVDGVARWLASRVDADGSVAHGIDARSGRVHRTGPFHLGRAAVAVEALAAHGRHASVVRRARAWLRASLLDALDQGGEGLPRTPAERAATLALAVRAGVDVRDALETLARREACAVASAPWHAAQVVATLGLRAPEEIRDAALGVVDAGTFAPWSVLAAEAVADRARARRARAVVARAVPSRGPHAGGVRPNGVPEVALTALAVEVLAATPATRAAASRGVAFLASQAYARDADVPAALDPALALGAFPLAPHADFLRVDASAHALLALMAARRAGIAVPPAGRRGRGQST